MPSELRPDLIPDSLAVSPVRIQVEQQFNRVVEQARAPYEGARQTPEESKNLIQTMSLLRDIIIDRQEKQGIAVKDRAEFTEEYPDFNVGTERIVFSVVKSEPGAYSKGAPFRGDIKNMVPMLRQEVTDPEHPGYKIAVMGYWLDHIVRLTCFARTNKAANRRVLWLQELVWNYTWYLRWKGVSRFLFFRRGEDFILEEQNQKLYGRPLDFYVRTEEISTVRERTLERLIVRSMEAPGSTSLDIGLIDNLVQ